ncbi:MAG: glutathione S-transferase family protein [Sphingobium sp.]|nr:glutathione S-transferase family protein [Sphingobium sp.]
MPIDPNSPIEVTAFDWVPPFARGQVRDLRVRWALEEAGLSYRTRLISARERPDWYFKQQPFGQVPYYRDGEVEMFECAAIALHIGEKSETLLPRDAPRRAQALTWLLAAMNSIDPHVMNQVTLEVFCQGQQWAQLRKPEQTEMLERRLNQLADALGDKPWFAGDFTVADILMVCTLRTALNSSAAIPDVLLEYVARGEARPAFQAALAAQMADFIPDEEGVPA